MDITGSAKILLNVRSQQGTLVASYLQFVKRGGRKSFDEFLEFKPEPGFFFFDVSQLAYHHLVDYYANHYGAKNILVLPQEALLKS